MILGLIFIFVIAQLLIILYRRWTLHQYLLRHFDSPPRHPLLGILHHFPRDSAGIFRVLHELTQQYGKNFLFCRPLFDTAISLADARDIETILLNPNTKKAKKGAVYKFLEPWLGTGLLTSYGEKWFTRRKIITPSFHFSILDGFVDVMNSQSDILLTRLQKECGKGEFDIYPLINAFALDVICETSMGVAVNAQSNPNSEYVTTVKSISTIVNHRAHHPLGKFKIYDFTSTGQRLKKMVQILHDFTNTVIIERRNQLISDDSANTGGRMNFLDILLHASCDGKPLSNEDIREEVDTFMFEGHDTTASGIAFTLYLLSRHPDIQERVHLELQDVFGDKDTMEISSAKLNQLPYLDMVIKESLRLLPPVPVISRELLEDTVISNVKIPAGVKVGLGIYAMHHDPDYFDEPEMFKPERFNASEVDARRNVGYFPFSAGGRNCIGQKFAILDLKTAIAKIVMNLKLLPGPEVILQGDLVLKSMNGVKVSLEAR